MSINWEKPKKVDKSDYTADGAPPGVYQPQMSDKDAQQWRGKTIRGKDPRIELRKSFTNGGYAQVLIVIRSDRISMSSNGKIEMTNDDWDELNRNVQFCQDRFFDPKWF